MTPKEFVEKWSKIQQKETSIAQSHFNDVCRLVGHPVPTIYDPSGENFSFELKTIKPEGSRGFADVFFKGHFIWEYKGSHKELDKAYRQLQLYRESLQNPPLLITSDIHNIIVHTNFNNYPTVKHTITFDDILSGNGIEKLGWAFFSPDKFKPEKTRQHITQATANSLLEIADQMKKHRDTLAEETYSDEQLAHFLVQLLFVFFIEDMKLLVDGVFGKIVQVNRDQISNLQPILRNLFTDMQNGGFFGPWEIRHFNGTLFQNAYVPVIPQNLGEPLLLASEQDWSQIDPSIFGTLFERVIDEGKRGQLGAHYTSQDDIMLIVEPVLMEPLKHKWDEVRRKAARLENGAAWQPLADFSAEIGNTRVLDPACGSGNFLYVALRQLLDLQKEVIAYAAKRGLPLIELTVNPKQLYGIEINPYAHELAQITAWIGYLQWRNENGFGEIDDPILRQLNNIKRMDAILAYDDDGNPVEPEWPAADIIIGNPPFLGTKMMRTELNDAYVDKVQELYADRIPKDVDLVCYWFEKARAEIVNQPTMRCGLLATNSIRGGSNREVLKRIKDSGDIFMAWSDRPWVLEGAAVRVSMVGFDAGVQQHYTLNGQKTAHVNADLTGMSDLTQAEPLLENKNIAFMGDTKQGPFDIDWQTAKKMLDAAGNPNGRSNSDVVRPWFNGMDVVRRSRNMWIIDFGTNMTEEDASQYLKPFAYVKKHVKPARKKNKRSWYRDEWWLHYAPRVTLRKSIRPFEKYIATARLAKHRLFVWLDVEIIPDSQLIVFARDDDYFFGMLHSHLHEIWSLRQGSWLGQGNDPRYTPTTTFETFPFPWLPGQEPSEEDERVAEIAYWARALVKWRQAWLNPPRNGMNGGIDTVYEKMLKKRTLTNLYNGLVYYRETVKVGQLFDRAVFDNLTRNAVTRAEIQELDDIHNGLDTAVLDAYGWPQELSDEAILMRLLALNGERAAAQNVE